MGLNTSKGNMYSFITHTFNTIKGACSHDCSYCYMKKWGHLKPVRLDESEFKTNLGKGNFIFVGSSCDMFADDIPAEWINRTLDYLNKFDNKYLIQTKNPARLKEFTFGEQYRFCTTIESNRWYPEIMNNCPTPQERANNMPIKQFITIEPILDFDIAELIILIKTSLPEQVNIGADSSCHNLPEPSKEKLKLLIEELSDFTTIHNKRNLKRLLK